MATNHLHHFHLLNEIGQLAVGSVVLATETETIEISKIQNKLDLEGS